MISRILLAIRTAALKIRYWRQLRHVGVDSTGRIYNQDPQTGAVRKVVIGEGGKLSVESKTEQRARRKFMRGAKSALRGI
jgi:hypothetical protein